MSINGRYHAIHTPKHSADYRTLHFAFEQFFKEETITLQFDGSVNTGSQRGTLLLNWEADVKKALNPLPPPPTLLTLKREI